MTKVRALHACGVRLARFLTVAFPLASLHAQDAPAPSVRPAFENLRFREDWSRPPQGSLTDPLKHIALNAQGSVWLSLGGHARVRAEQNRNYLGGGPGTRDDSFALARVHLHADVHLGTHVRVFVEGRHAEAGGRDLPGGTRSIDRDVLDWGNLFGEMTGTLGAGQIALRVGRQELALGRERLVSPLDWVNVRRVFEGATLETRRGAWRLGAFATRPVIVRASAPDRASTDTRFAGATVSWQRASSPRVMEGAVLVKSVDAEGERPSVLRTTVSGRLVTPLGRPNVLLEVESGVQRVRGAGPATFASMLASDVRWSLPGRWAPVITLGIDRASGTGANAGAQSGTWDQLFPLAHAYAGFADVLGRRNLLEQRVVLQATATRSLSVRLAAHAFQRASTSDGVYDVAGGVLRASRAGTPRSIGSELDATAQWRVSRYLRLDVGAARFAPGAFLAATGAARPYRWAFASFTTVL